MQIDYSTYELSKSRNCMFYAAYFALSIVVSELFYEMPFAAVVMIPFVRRVREYIISWLGERRKRQLLSEFKDMLFMISTSIGAGRSIKDAIHEAIPGIENIYGEKSYLAPEMQQIYQRLESGNEKDVDVLMDFAVRTDIEDIVDFVNIYAACKQTGASLIIALNKAASVIIDKMSIDKEIRELVKRKESEGLLIFAMPIIVILFLNLLAPDYIAPLYDTIAGRIIMTLCIISNVGIYGMIRKITHVDI